MSAPSAGNEDLRAERGACLRGIKSSYKNSKGEILLDERESVLAWERAKLAIRVHSEEESVREEIDEARRWGEP